MANVSDATITLAWSVLLLLFFRSLSVCSFLFVSVNASIFVRSSIQVHSGSKGVPSTARNRRAGPNSNKRDDEVVEASDRRRNINKVPRPPEDAQYKRTPPLNPSQDSFDDENISISPKQQHNPSHGTIMRMYEEIIASDAETIQVQQTTIHSQQEIIRSQREMIQKLQQLVEAQDGWIEEHLEESNK